MTQKTVITIISLNKLYGKFAKFVLSSNEFVTRLPKHKKGEVAKFGIIKPLPSADEYRALENSYFCKNVTDAIEMAKEELSNLRDEMENWRDNLPESLQYSEKGEAVNECADNLSSIYDTLESLDEVPEVVNAEFVSKIMFDGSRSNRLSDVISLLQDAASALDDKIDDVENDIEENEEDVALDIDSVRSIKDELDNAVSELENIEFPGMY
jgi:hypothetical protein